METTKEKGEKGRKKKQNEVYFTRIFGFEGVNRTEQAVISPLDSTCLFVSLCEMCGIFAVGFPTRGMNLCNEGYCDRNCKKNPKKTTNHTEKVDGH